VDTDSILRVVASSILVLVALLTLADFLRHRDRPRLDIALMFAAFAILILGQAIASVANTKALWLGIVAAIGLLAHPYLQLRLVQHFRTVPRPVVLVALVGIVVFLALAIALRPTLPTPITVAVIVYFTYLEGYAAAAFVLGARATGGVTRWRLTLAASGSGAFAVLILLAGITPLLKVNAGVASALSSVLALVTVLSYYVGFVPPGWLRQTWQLSELYRFLDEMWGLVTTKRASESVDLLCPAAVDLTGGVGAVAALWDDAAQRLEIRASSNGTASIGAPVTADSAMGRAWRSGKPAVLASRSDFGAEERQVAGEKDVGAMLAVPIATEERAWGLLAVFLRREPLFAADDLRMLTLLAAQSALALHRAELFDQQQRLVERLSESNTELERASRLKSEFLANMSHELRTPLNAIIGFSELLLDEPAEGYDRPARTAYLETIHESGQHLLALINDILDLSKVEAGKMELRLERCVVSDLLAQVINTVEPLAARAHVTVVIDADGTVELSADEGKLKQILYNLLSNAIKFTPAGGRVTVATRRLADSVELTVTDTGIGIAGEDQERIFQEFQQLDAGPDRQRGGTGLGLALTRRFAELHGGRVWVESTPGQGSRFHVSLPLRSVAEASDALSEVGDVPLAEPPRRGDRPLVLVVEDDVRAANLLTLYLGRGGYRTDVVADGAQALDAAKALQPVAITLDILLPSLDGWEVLRELKRDEKTRDIPVVVVSVVGNEELGYALGAVDYFVKPVDRQALLARLGRYTFTTKVRQREVRVLVVDDDPSAVTLLDGILRPAGFTVLGATGGAEGIATAQADHPDLILLDLMMPDVSGFEVIRALKSDDHTRNIPILVVTAKDLSDEDKVALNGHVAAVLRKGDLAGVELLALLDEIVARLGHPKGEHDAG